MSSCVGANFFAREAFGFGFVADFAFGISFSQEKDQLQNTRLELEREEFAGFGCDVTGTPEKDDAVQKED